VERLKGVNQDYVVVVFNSDINFIGNGLNILSIRQRIKRRYCKEKALKLFGDPDFLARVLRVAETLLP
jgi:hypothetical protein